MKAIKHITISIKTDNADGDNSGTKAIKNIIETGAVTKGYSFESGLNEKSHPGIKKAYMITKQ